LLSTAPEHEELYPVLETGLLLLAEVEQDGWVVSELEFWLLTNPV
jgi:hypothetical protein